ncbi:glycoside hydrolase family 2 TIM barrel-domain containing protein [Asticcacaulis sp. YBE204]|uniref:glycoside hydrolase family 2 TIM barrel-domain containing protein n=1 Tax=Asticcacaulis sp. YBE204 TaxID=1282363 RepID=UPI0003C3C13C|nr:glycoside hydrolase family 2 TIM barrel-domain containing protein [Asticcacaulis sp. YBE204]ESQ79232.1 hypothetical protein AEYBE204_09490 [Asticcacaulis sp. YBE204]
MWKSLVLAMVAVWVSGTASVQAERLDLSSGWAFHKGATFGAEALGFDDSDWSKVSVPHDFSIQDKPDGSPPFSKEAVSGQDSGYLPGGEGWYRREFSLTSSQASATVLLQFEAVYMDADIWLNGTKIATHHYGYTAFTLDLTGKAKAGRNLISVRINHVDPSSRWYAGSGIIRPVHLELLDKLHIDPLGVAIATPVATVDKGEIEVSTHLKNRGGKAGKVTLTTVVVDAHGTQVAISTESQALAAGGSADLLQRLMVTRPQLWSIDSPNLYRLIQTVRVEGRVVDERVTRFGIRSITVDAEHGVRLNGQPIELKGGNIHHDNYMLGAAGWPDADKRKVALMKSAGYNAIRNAHNPASQATLDAADELGVLIVNEAFDMWGKSKKSKDYARFFAADWQQDIDSMVLSGRNHPSVIFWSIGNEIPEQGSADGARIATMLSGRIRTLDPTRFVTHSFTFNAPNNTALIAALDVIGQNYKAPAFEAEHQAYPNRVVYSPESTSKDGFRYWQIIEKMPSAVGDFVWTSVDYLGETGIGWMGYSKDWKQLGPYPWHLAYAGEIDATGRKRPAAYYREVFWKTGLTPISAFVRQPKGSEDLPDRFLFNPPAEVDWSLEDLHESWTWPGQDGKPLEVVVYSEFPGVELRLNGRSLGRKAVSVDTEFKATFSVPYEPGVLTAIGYRDGKAAGQWELRSAGKPASARVTVDRHQMAANGRDLAYVSIEILDANGVPVYAQTDDRKITIKVKGVGKLLGAGSGHPARLESFTSGHLTSFHGRAVAVIQSRETAGQIAIEISVDQLPVKRITVQTIH